MAGGDSEDTSTASFGQKRAREEHDGKITICITNQEGRDMLYKVEPHIKLQNVLKSYCNQYNMDFPTVSFIYDSKKVNKKMTPAQLKIKEGGVILAAVVASSG